MIKEYFFNYELMNDDLTLDLGHPEKMDIHRCHDECGWRVTLVETGEKALKGARLKRIEKYIEDDEFMVAYGDSLADIDLRDLLKFLRAHGKIATVTGVNIASRFGELALEQDRVVAFNEKPRTTDRFINGGFFVFSRKIFDYLSPADDCDLEVGSPRKYRARGTADGVPAPWFLGLHGHLPGHGILEPAMGGGQGILENLGMTEGLRHYANKTVLVTGDTGFKGSWLATWLLHLGAKVVGFSLPPGRIGITTWSAALRTVSPTSTGTYGTIVRCGRSSTGANPRYLFIWRPNPWYWSPTVTPP